MRKTAVEKHFDNVSKNYDSGKQKYSYYYFNLKKLLGSQIKPNKKVLEIGCGTGDLLVSLKPKNGYGQDISSEMIRIAKSKHGKNKNIKFSTSWPKTRDIFATEYGKYEYIFMSDVIEHLGKPDEAFKKVSKLMTKKSKFIITMANPIWEPMLLFWEKMGWKMKEGPHRRITFKEIEKLLRKSDLNVVKHDYTLLVPVEIPLITKFVNNYFGRILKPLSFIEFIVAARS